MSRILILEDDEAILEHMLGQVPAHVTADVARDTQQFFDYLRSIEERGVARAHFLDDVVPNRDGVLAPGFIDNYHRLFRRAPGTHIYCTTGKPSEAVLQFVYDHGVKLIGKNIGSTINKLFPAPE